MFYRRVRVFDPIAMIIIVPDGNMRGRECLITGLHERQEEPLDVLFRSIADFEFLEWKFKSTIPRQLTVRALSVLFHVRSHVRLE